MSQLYESEDELVNCATAAKIYGCSRAKLHRDRHQKTGLPYYYQGERCIRYRVSDILKATEANYVLPEVAS